MRNGAARCDGVAFVPSPALAVVVSSFKVRTEQYKKKKNHKNKKYQEEKETFQIASI